MNKFGKKITSLLICTVFILTSFGTAAVFADGITTVVSEDFSNEDNYSTTSFHVMQDRELSNSDNGNVTFPENENPLYGKMFRFEQFAVRNEMYFDLSDRIVLSNKTENDYAEFSFDMRGDGARAAGLTTNVLLMDSKASATAAQFGIQNSDKAVINNAQSIDNFGTSETLRHIRIQMNLGNKQITGVWADGVKLGYTYPITFTASDIGCVRVGFGKATSKGAMLVDNLSLITYQSTDGTSPVADKTALRAKITSIYPLADSLSGATLANFNTALANAVSIAHNPSATSAQVTAATEELETFENMPVCSVYEKFDDETYEDITIENTESGTLAIVTDSDQTCKNMFEFTPNTSRTYTNLWFAFDNPIKLGDDKYTEISYDIKGVSTSGGSGSTVNSCLVDSSGKIGLQLGFDKNGKLSLTTDTTISSENGYVNNAAINNVRVQINNAGKEIKAIYINGTLLEINGMTYPIALGNSISTVAKVRAFVSKTTTLKFRFDNLIVATYKSSTGAALPDKMTLRDAIRSGYSRVKAIEASGTAVDAGKLAALKSAIADAETVLENIGASESENKAAASAVIAAAVNTGMSISSYYEITGVTFADVSGNTSSIPVGGGKVTGFTVEKKNDMSIDFTGVLAVYNTDAESTADRLIGVAISDNLADKAAGTYTIPCDITLPNDISGVSGKIMSWNSISGMVPYAGTEDFFTQGV